MDDLAKLLADPSTRASAAAELRRQAERDDSAGNRAYAAGRYSTAAAAWSRRARRLRAAAAIDAGHSIDQRDRVLVHAAAATVADRRAGTGQSLKGGSTR
jgi:hypothetical protein